MSFSPTGQKLIGLSCGTSISRLSVWETESGRELFHAEWNYPEDFIHYKSEITADEQFVIARFGCLPIYARIYDLETGHEIIPGKLDDVQDVIMSPDCKHFLVCYTRKSPELWDAQLRKSLYSVSDLNRDRGQVSLEDKYIVQATYEGGCEYWNIANGARITHLEGLSLLPMKGVLSPDKTHLIAPELHAKSGWNGTRLFDSASMKQIALVDGPSDPTNPFSPDGSRFITTDYVVRASDAQTRIRSVNDGKIVATLPGGAMGFSSDGRWLATVILDWDSELETVIVWDAKTYQRQYELPGFRQIANIEFSRDGNRGIVNSESSQSRTACIFDMPAKKVVKQFFENIHFSPDQRRLISERFRSIALYDSLTCELLAEIKAQEQAVISPNHQQIATMNADGIRVWKRIRDEEARGILQLPIFWLTLLFTFLAMWSLWRDRREVRRMTAALSGEKPG